MLKATTFTLVLAAATLAALPAMAKKVCTNTYNPDGTRCTFCYYTTQPGSGSTKCIKIKANTGSGNSSSTKAPGAFKLQR